MSTAVQDLTPATDDLPPPALVFTDSAARKVCSADAEIDAIELQRAGSARRRGA